MIKKYPPKFRRIYHYLLNQALKLKKHLAPVLNAVKKKKLSIFLLLLAVLIVLAAISFGLARPSFLKIRPTGTSGSESLKLLEQLGSPYGDQNAFVAKVRLLAKPTDTIIVGSQCALSPPIASVQSGTDLVFQNRDYADHIIYTSETIITTASEDITVKAVFLGPGVYSISCDELGVVGYIELTDKK